MIHKGDVVAIVRGFGTGLLKALSLVLLGVLAVHFLASCAVFSNRWAVPHGPPKLRPCVGTYVYPDSASVCAPKEER